MWKVSLETLIFVDKRVYFFEIHTKKITFKFCKLPTDNKNLYINFLHCFLCL